MASFFDVNCGTPTYMLVTQKGGEEIARRCSNYGAYVSAAIIFIFGLVASAFARIPEAAFNEDVRRSEDFFESITGKKNPAPKPPSPWPWLWTLPLIGASCLSILILLISAPLAMHSFRVQEAAFRNSGMSVQRWQEFNAQNERTEQIANSTVTGATIIANALEKRDTPGQSPSPFAQRPL
jgi:hypothetical protein